jgi:hypothetical protein
MRNQGPYTSDADDGLGTPLVVFLIVGITIGLGKAAGGGKASDWLIYPLIGALCAYLFTALAMLAASITGAILCKAWTGKADPPKRLTDTLMYALMVVAAYWVTADNWTSARELSNACYQQKTRYHNTNDGQTCKDGWRSGSDGSGRCSWHGGVDHTPMMIEETYYPKTRERCDSEASATSWID